MNSREPIIWKIYPLDFEFEGDYTLVLFSFLKQLKKTPEHLGNEIGEYLLQHNADFFLSYNVIKGFLNLTIADDFYTSFFL